MPRAQTMRDAKLDFGAVDASAAPVKTWRAPCRCVIQDISMITPTAVAAHATDIMTVVVLNLGVAGAGSDEVGRQTVDTDVAGSAATAANIPWPLILTTTLADLEVLEGEVIQVTITEGGTATSGDMSADTQVSINYLPGAGLGA